jgi:hypothetical protein
VLQVLPESNAHDVVSAPGPPRSWPGDETGDIERGARGRIRHAASGPPLVEQIHHVLEEHAAGCRVASPAEPDETADEDAPSPAASH